MSPSRYWELTVEVPEEASEGVTNLVWELGALGVVEEEAPGRPPRLRAFFPKTVFARALEKSVREYLAGLRELGFPGAGEPSVVALANEDWAEAWRAHFRPLPVGKRLLIAPPWDRPPANGRVVIAIEPGRAFGTGQHPSTLGCLERLESLIARTAPRRLIDLGTGSGVLRSPRRGSASVRFSPSTTIPTPSPPRWPTRPATGSAIACAASSVTQAPSRTRRRRSSWPTS